jgi:hypothetical protein
MRKLTTRKWTNGDRRFLRVALHEWYEQKKKQGIGGSHRSLAEEDFAGMKSASRKHEKQGENYTQFILFCPGSKKSAQTHPDGRQPKTECLDVHYEDEARHH